jgi:DNA/RNA-binding domain of Phe-tRNA-synthetase-like protein
MSEEVRIGFLVIILNLKITESLADRFPDLRVQVIEINGLRVALEDHKLEEFKTQAFADLRNKYALESLKDQPVFRSYRDFFWKVGVDPTKTRPAAEALIRRVLGGRTIPRINTAVDAYNLASMTTCVALAAFDLDRIDGDVTMRFADGGEAFHGIGMDKSAVLAGGEVVMADNSRLIAVYPYRDADYSKIDLQTTAMMLVSCGVPGVSLGLLGEAADKACEFVTRFCDGKTSS